MTLAGPARHGVPVIRWKESDMATYRIVHGGDAEVDSQTFDDVEIGREDGWTLVRRGTDVILRVRDEYVRSVERLENEPLPGRSATGQPLVRDLMRPALISVEQGAHLAAAAYLMKHAGDTALVVVNDDVARVPVAVLTDVDVAQAVADGKNPNDVRIADLISREPITVAPETPVTEAVQRMISHRIRHLPVVADGAVVGMIDLSDASGGLLQQAGSPESLQEDRRHG
jgi:CBS domain-containing protein